MKKFSPATMGSWDFFYAKVKDKSDSERDTGIEPAPGPWKGPVLPLY